MRRYYYTDGHNRFGPFSLYEIRRKKLPEYIQVWHEGLNGWVKLSEVNELHVEKHKRTSGNKKQLYFLILFIIAVIIITAGSTVYKLQEDTDVYKSISATSYDDGETDFQLYVDKFYRDLEYFGIFPKKPSKTIIRFAKLDQLDNTTHFHAISFGYEDDSLIEIYINPSTWKNFSKPMRYYLMYHELSHDILNLDDLEPSFENEGNLMFPNISSFESLTMDDFIERSHLVFEEFNKNIY